MDDTNRRIYVACGVAAGVAASFNAPLAGLFFAIEIALGGLTSLSLAALGPIVLAAISGTMMNRVFFGEAEEAFKIAETATLSPWEFPAFILLGLACAVASITLLRAAKFGWYARKTYLTRLPGWAASRLSGPGLGPVRAHDARGAGPGL